MPLAELHETIEARGAEFPLRGRYDERFRPVVEAFIDNFTGEEELGAGASVVLNARDNVALGAAAQDLAATGATVNAVAFDVTSRDSIGEAVAYIEDEIGPIDILVNNAGMQFRSALEA